LDLETGDAPNALYFRKFYNAFRFHADSTGKRLLSAGDAMARGPRYAIPAPTPARLSDGPFLVTTHQMHFVIPTYRLRDVGETVEAYDDNFARCGQSAPITVFDDSSIANHQKYYDTLEATRTQNEVWYVGPAEKEQFLGYICRRLKDRKLDMLVRNLFRPSYGGNRNFTLMYTLGDLMVSADDDMRPYALIEDSPEALAENEVSRGKLIPRGANGHSRKSYDILASFRDILGRTVADAPANYDQGELLVDSAMDLETNNSLGFCRDNALTLQPGTLPRGGSSRWRRPFAPAPMTLMRWITSTCSSTIPMRWMPSA
jgi:hypothetical protein